MILERFLRLAVFITHSQINSFLKLTWCVSFALSIDFIILQVNFASGTSLWFDLVNYAGAYYMNINLKPPGLDFGQTIGLCGNFNDIAADDAPSNGYHYFTVASLPSSTQITDDLFTFVASSNYTLKDNSSCPLSPNLLVGTDITALLQNTQAQGIPNVVVIDPTEIVEDEFPLLNDDQISALCIEKLVNSELGQACAALGVNVQAFVEGCIIDLKLTQGNPRFVNDAFLGLQAICLDVAPANTPVVGLICPRACSGNGVCNRGVCTCNQGFTDVDCSVNTNIPPTVLVISSSQCDVQVAGDCPSVITVTGFNFYASANLVCRFGDVITKATFISPISVLCALPNSPADVTTNVTARVCVSNDGDKFSTAILPFTWFDSLCFVCEGDVCVENPNSCRIQGRCYSAGSVSAASACLTCQPSVNPNDWTNICITCDRSDICNGVGDPHYTVNKSKLY